MSRVATVVFAHGDAMGVVERHLPVWKSSTDFLLIVSPKDNPCVVNGVDCLTYSLRQHYGEHALERQMFAMKTVLGYGADQYVFLEYDALMLQRPISRSVIQGNLFNAHKKAEKEALYSGKCFLHFPWVFPVVVLKEFVTGVEALPYSDLTHWTSACQDVWMAQKLFELKFDVHNLLVFCGGSEGYSQNTLNTQDKIEEAVGYVKRGVYALHGVKSETAFNAIMLASKIVDQD